MPLIVPPKVVSPNTNISFLMGANVWNISDGALTASTGVVAAARMYATPMSLRRPFRVAKLGYEITSGVAGNCHIGLAACNQDGSPQTLLYDSGNISTAGAAFVAHTMTAPIDLPSGEYWMYWQASGTPTVRTRATAGSMIGATWTTGSAAFAIGLEVLIAYGAFPPDAWELSWGLTAGVVPLLGFQPE